MNLSATMQGATVGGSVAASCAIARSTPRRLWREIGSERRRSADGHRGVSLLKDAAVLSARNVSPCERPIRHCRGTIDGRSSSRFLVSRPRESSRAVACAYSRNSARRKIGARRVVHAGIPPASGWDTWILADALNVSSKWTRRTFSCLLIQFSTALSTGPLCWNFGIIKFNAASSVDWTDPDNLLVEIF